jgi:hypothetical protein
MKMALTADLRARVCWHPLAFGARHTGITTMNRRLRKPWRYSAHVSGKGEKRIGERNSAVGKNDQGNAVKYRWRIGDIDESGIAANRE